MTGEIIHIKQVRTFERAGFAFTFPEFDGWEVTAIQKKTPDLSIIFINSDFLIPIRNRACFSEKGLALFPTHR
ncbi:MAG: hypothetical protein ABIF71_11845 [Planctomycetota bacterium]